jgi:hypothetical protein
MMSQIAAIYNLELVRTAAERLKNRTAGLPGIAALYGPAGYGKTTAALAIANENRAYFVQMRSAWGRKALLEKVLIEMGAQPHGTIPQLLDQVCEQLATSNRMLMIDEFDYCVRGDSLVELVRDIYEGSQSTDACIARRGNAAAEAQEAGSASTAACCRGCRRSPSAWRTSKRPGADLLPPACAGRRGPARPPGQARRRQRAPRLRSTSTAIAETASCRGLGAASTCAYLGRAAASTPAMRRGGAA